MTKKFKLILATSNKDKAREIAEILNDTPFVVTTMKEEGYNPHKGKGSTCAGKECLCYG